MRIVKKPTEKPTMRKTEKYCFGDGRKPTEKPIMRKAERRKKPFIYNGFRVFLVGIATINLATMKYLIILFSFYSLANPEKATYKCYSSKGQGTCFFAGDSQTILTAAHNLVGSRNNPIRLVDSSGQHFANGYPKRVNIYQDIALLESDTPSDYFTVFDDGYKPKPRDYRLLGYPAGKLARIKLRRFFDRHFLMMREIKPRYTHEGIYKGASGSPIYLQSTNEVVGVYSRAHEEGVLIAGGIIDLSHLEHASPHTRAIRALLNESDDSYECNQCDVDNIFLKEFYEQWPSFKDRKDLKRMWNKILAEFL